MLKSPSLPALRRKRATTGVRSAILNALSLLPWIFTAAGAGKGRVSGACGATVVGLMAASRPVSSDRSAWCPRQRMGRGVGQGSARGGRAGQSLNCGGGIRGPESD